MLAAHSPAAIRRAATQAARTAGRSRRNAAIQPTLLCWPLFMERTMTAKR